MAEKPVFVMRPLPQQGEQSLLDDDDDDELVEVERPTSISASEQDPFAAPYAPSIDELTLHNDRADVISISSKTSQDTTVQDLLDVDIDPQMLVSSLDMLLQTLWSSIDILVSLQEDENDLKDDTNAGVLTVCQQLHGHVDELRGVVNPHSSPQQSHNVDRHVRFAAQRVDVDPEVYKWTSDCVVLCLALQADLQLLLDQHKKIDVSDTESWADTLVSEDDEDEAEEIVTLHRYVDSLKRFSTQLEEFMPIIKADFNETKTAALDFPTQTEGSDPYRIFQRERGASFHMHDQATYERSLLYVLKDDLKSCLDLIRDETGSIEPLVTAAPLIAEIQASGSMVWATLTTALSNHGSEWIESGLAGGLSWDDFRAFLGRSREWQRFSWDFKTLLDDVKVEAARARVEKRERWRRTGGAERTYLMILEDQLLPTIMHLHELEEMLKVRRN